MQPIITIARQTFGQLMTFATIGAAAVAVVGGGLWAWELTDG